MRCLPSLIFILLSCASACRVGTPPDCITRCGLGVFNAAHSCDEYQFAEDVTLREFLRVTDTRLHECKLDDWRVEIQPTENFISLGLEVSGRTFCWEHKMHVGNALPNRSSLPHEMAHAMQNCEPKPPLDPADQDHSNWVDGGIYDAISRIRSAK